MANNWLLGLFAVAALNTLLTTALYFKLRPLVREDYVFQEKAVRLGKVWLMASISLELLLCVVLNTNQDQSYYLYSFSPLFALALFADPTLSLIAAMIVATSYLAARLSGYLVNGVSFDWLQLLINLVGFGLVTFLASYLIAVAEQLRNYASIIGRYRGNLEQQNQALSQTNHQLEYLSDFSRVLQSGVTPTQVEHLAVQYLNHFLTTQRGKSGLNAETTYQVQLLKDEVAREWKQVAPSSLNLTGEQANGVVRLEHEGLSFWLIPLVHQAENFGSLALPMGGQNEKRSELEKEDRLLVSLLADQLAYVLSSFKQTQALAVEAERARLAMDMHDVVAQSLFGIAYNLDACLKLFDKDPHASRQRLTDLRGLAFNTLSSVRAIIYDLWNEETGETDFANFLQSYIKKAGQLYPFKIDFEIQPSYTGPRTDFKLDQERQKSLYRLMQEALSNAAKHSGADRVVIRLCRTATDFTLEISDNGRGFVAALTPATTPPQNGQDMNLIPGASGGMGLQTMRERAEGLGGSLVVESYPQKGTTIKVTLPL